MDCYVVILQFVISFMGLGSYFSVLWPFLIAAAFESNITNPHFILQPHCGDKWLQNSLTQQFMAGFLPLFELGS